MSPRHSSNAEPVLSSQALDRVLANPRVQERLHDYMVENQEYDLPYLAGYSQDGKTFYVDCHLPEELSFDDDGQKRTFRPDVYVRRHEQLEKVLMDVLGWTYWPAHSAANAYERRAVLRDLGPGAWPLYERCVLQYVKADEREKLVRVPPDLDMAPYYASPVDKALIARMQEAQGKSRQFTKLEVDYVDKGRPSEHCGPVTEWPRGRCKHFETPHACDLVRGYIVPRGWCKKWEARGER